MHKRNYILAGLLVLAAVHIGVAGSMIWRHEHTLQTGDRYRFQTEPVDPYDAFRGRYVALDIDTRMPAARRFAVGQTVYAAVAENKDGFAEFSMAHAAPPDGAYIQAAVKHWRGGAVDIHNPFDRYYMNEALAPAAEQAYRRHSRRQKQDAWIAVRIRDGFAVIEELYIGDRPIAQYLAEKTDAD
ncbi:MAG: GDYXXLXY domain-containing protein [Thermodesulfobacteriota bacterium]